MSQVNVQRQQDREQFERLYKNWQKETYIMSNVSQIRENENYQAIVRMGRRAVPFIYEKAKAGEILLFDVLEKVYGCKMERNALKVNPEQFLNNWLRKIEEGGDVQGVEG